MLFDIYHSVYIAISLVITVGALILFRKLFTPPTGIPRQTPVRAYTVKPIALF